MNITRSLRDLVLRTFHQFFDMFIKPYKFLFRRKGTTFRVHLHTSSDKKNYKLKKRKGMEGMSSKHVMNIKL